MRMRTGENEKTSTRPLKPGRLRNLIKEKCTDGIISVVLDVFRYVLSLMSRTRRSFSAKNKGRWKKGKASRSLSANARAACSRPRAALRTSITPGSALCHYMSFEIASMLVCYTITAPWCSFWLNTWSQRFYFSILHKIDEYCIVDLKWSTSCNTCSGDNNTDLFLFSRVEETISRFLFHSFRLLCVLELQACWLSSLHG